MTLFLNVFQYLFAFLLVTLSFSTLSLASEGVTPLNSPNDVDLLFFPSKPLFVKFYAPWCGHCKQLAPTWSKLATTLDEVTIAHIDCTVEDHGYCTTFGVRSYPTLKLISNGKVYAYGGQRNEEELTAFAKGGWKDTEATDLPRKPPVVADYIDADGRMKEIDNAVAGSLEQAPGLLPHPVETQFPAQKKHSALVGTPGPSPAMGSPDAPVKVFIWSDFQCPNCKRAAEPLKWLSLKYPEVQVIFKQLPLEMHKKALPSAKASLAAAKQGKFWEFHDLLWKTRKINPEDMEVHAKTLGLDIAQWNNDKESEQIQKEIDYDVSLAGALGLTGTPGIIVNGRVSKGWGSVFGVENTVKAVIRSLPDVQKKTDSKGLPYASTKQTDAKIANFIWGVEDEKTEL